MKELLQLAYEKVKIFFKYRTFNMFSDVQIEISSYCNRRCWYCPNSKYDRGTKRNYLSEKIFFKLINDLAEISYSGLLTFSGYLEPMADDRLNKFVLYAKRKLPKSTIQIFTNGDYLNQESYSKLIDNGCDNILLTSNTNLDHPLMDADKVTFRKIKDIRLSNRAGELNINGEKKYCIYVFLMVIVDYLGQVKVCCNDYLGKVVLGNLETNSIMEIWNSEQYKRVKFNLLIRKTPNLKICEKCMR